MGEPTQPESYGPTCPLRQPGDALWPYRLTERGTIAAPSWWDYEAMGGTDPYVWELDDRCYFRRGHHHVIVSGRWFPICRYGLARPDIDPDAPVVSYPSELRHFFRGASKRGKVQRTGFACLKNILGQHPLACFFWDGELILAAEKASLTFATSRHSFGHLPDIIVNAGWLSRRRRQSKGTLRWPELKRR